MLVLRFVFILHMLSIRKYRYGYTQISYLIHKHIYHTQKIIERQYHYAEKQKTGDLQNVHMTGI